MVNKEIIGKLKKEKKLEKLSGFQIDHIYTQLEKKTGFRSKENDTDVGNKFTEDTKIEKSDNKHLKKKKTSFINRFIKDVKIKDSVRNSCKDNTEVIDELKSLQKQDSLELEGVYNSKRFHRPVLSSMAKVQRTDKNNFKHDITNQTDIEQSNHYRTQMDGESVLLKSSENVEKVRKEGKSSLKKISKDPSFYNNNKTGLDFLMGFDAHLDSIAKIESVGKDSLFSFGRDGVIKQWHLNFEEEIQPVSLVSSFRHHSSEIFSSAKAKDKIFSGDSSGKIKVLNKEKNGWELKRSFHSGREPIWSLDYNESNSLLLSSAPNKIKFWRLDQLSNSTAEIESSSNSRFFSKTKWLSSSNYLSYTHVSNWKTNGFFIYDLYSQKPLTKIPHVDNFCNDFSVEKSKKMLFSANENKTVSIYDIRSSDLIKSFVAQESPVTTLCVVDENLLLTSDIDSSLRLWDLRTFRCLFDVAVFGGKYNRSIFDIGYMAGGLVCTAGADSCLRFFKLG